MLRTLFVATCSLLSMTALPAQCANFAPTGTLIGYGDEASFGHVPLGFAFPMAGSAGTGTWTHFRACSNGWLVLTDGVNASGIMGPNNHGSIAQNYPSSLYGGPIAVPRIAPYWNNLVALPSLAPDSGVWVDSSNAGVSTKILWRNVVDYTAAGGGPLKSFQVELFATGVIQFSYSFGMNYDAGGTKYVGVSAGNGTLAPAGSDLFPGGVASGTVAMHQLFTVPGTFDLGGRTLTFTPVAGGLQQTVSCGLLPASHTPYGSGCYAPSPMTLGAAPAPVSTPVAGTLCAWTQSNVPEAAPGFGVRVGATIFSLSQDLPGTSLAFLGMPGCAAHIGSLDLMVAFVGTSETLVTPLAIPAGVPYGVRLFAQSVALVVPHSLPGGNNAFGAVVSNGVASFISSQ